MGLRNDQKVKTRERLLKAARGLFALHGYEGTGTRDIAAAAGVSTGALFAHWPSGKPALWREVMRDAPDAKRLAEVMFGASA